MTVLSIAMSSGNKLNESPELLRSDRSQSPVGIFGDLETRRDGDCGLDCDLGCKVGSGVDEESIDFETCAGNCLGSCVGTCVATCVGSVDGSKS